MFSRICHQCKKEVFHTQKRNRDYADKLGKPCKSCGYKNKDVSGINNPFYGKKHTEKTIKRLKLVDRSYAKNNKFKSPNRRSAYAIWVERFGKQKADELESERKRKLSKSSSGEKNRMYGKPPPNGAGNGWSGWYKEKHFFRSLRELSFIVEELDGKRSWASAEQEKYKIQYVDPMGRIRNYFPDFIVDGKELIECKPLKLINTPMIKCKTSSAIDFCKKNNLTYKIVSPDIISLEKIIKLRNSGVIKFTKFYEGRFLEYVKHHLT